MMEIDQLRVGQGFDSHRLIEHRSLVIGGVNLPYARGLAGHSDADVLVHALIDAMLGAAGMMDIGTMFPDTEPRFKDADSCELLAEVCRRFTQQGWRIVNADATVIAQEPRLGAYIPAMREKLCKILKLNQSALNIKAKTAEHMGALGRGEGIAATCVVLAAPLCGP